MNVEKTIEALKCYAFTGDAGDCKSCPAECMCGYPSAQFMQDVCDMVSKQLPAEPFDVSGKFISCGVCGYNFKGDEPNYCPVCGQKVKWK